MDTINMQARVSELKGIPVTTVQLISTVYNASTALCTVAFILKNCVPPYPPVLSTTTVPDQSVIHVDWFDDSWHEGRETVSYSSLKKHTAGNQPISLQTLRHAYSLNSDIGVRDNSVPILTTGRPPQRLPKFKCLWLPGLDSQQFYTEYGTRPVDIWDICLLKPDKSTMPSRNADSLVTSRGQYSRATHKITRNTPMLTSPPTAAVHPQLLPLLWVTPEVVIVSWMSIPWRSRVVEMTKRSTHSTQRVWDKRVIAESTGLTLPRMAYVIDRGYRATGNQSVSSDTNSAPYLQNEIFHDQLKYKFTNDETVRFDISVNLSAGDTVMAAKYTAKRPVFNIHTILLGRPLPTAKNANPATKFLTVAYFSAAGQRATDHNFTVTWTVCSLTVPHGNYRPDVGNLNSVMAPEDKNSTYDDDLKATRKKSNRPLPELCVAPATQRLSATLYSGVEYTVATTEWNYKPRHGSGITIQYHVNDTYDHRQPHSRAGRVRGDIPDIHSVIFNSARLALPLDFVGILNSSVVGPVENSTEHHEVTPQSRNVRDTPPVLSNSKVTQRGNESVTQKLIPTAVLRSFQPGAYDRHVGRVQNYQFNWHHKSLNRSRVTSLDSGDKTDVVLDIDTGCSGRYPEPFAAIINNASISNRWFTILSRAHPEKPGNIYFLVLPCFLEALRDSAVTWTPWCNHNESHFHVTLQCHETPFDYYSHVEEAGVELRKRNASLSHATGAMASDQPLHLGSTATASSPKTPVEFAPPESLDLSLTEFNDTYTWTPFGNTGCLFFITTRLLGQTQWDSSRQQEAFPGSIFGGGGDSVANMYSTVFYFSKLGDYQRTHRFNVSLIVTGYSEGPDRHPVTLRGSNTPLASLILDDRRDYGIAFYEWPVLLPLDDIAVRYIVTDEYQTLVTTSASAFPQMQPVIDTYLSAENVLDPDGKSHSYKYFFSWLEFKDIESLRTPTHFYMISPLTRCPVGWPEQAMEIQGHLLHRFANQSPDGQPMVDSSDTIKLSCPEMKTRHDMMGNAVILSQMPWCGYDPPNFLTVRLYCGHGSKVRV